MNIYLFIIIIIILLGVFYFFKEKLSLNEKAENSKSDDYKHYVKKNYSAPLRQGLTSPEKNEYLRTKRYRPKVFLQEPK